MTALGRELLDVLASAEGRAVLADVVREAVRAEVRAALDERDAAELLDGPALARVLGITPAALRMRLARGSALAALAVDLDGRRAWKRAEVQALLQRPAGGAEVVPIAARGRR